MKRQVIFAIGLLVLSASVLLAQSATAAVPYVDKQAYRIYSVLLSKEEAAELAKGTVVIRQESAVNPETPACLTEAATRKFAEAIEDYKRVNRKPWLLEREFETTTPYEIVDSNTIEGLLRQGGWDAFYQRYPVSAGYITFSAVGFNRDKTQAVVYARSSCGTVCGRWGLHLLEKIGEEWKESVGVTCVTVS